MSITVVIEQLGPDGATFGGPNVTAVVESGVKGDAGPPGDGGGGSLTIQEADGTPSATATTLIVDNGTLSFPSPSTARLTGLQGPTGPTGPTGATGATGATGPNSISDATTLGSLTSAATDALFLLASNGDGNAAREVPLGANGRSLLGAATSQAGRLLLGVGNVTTSASNLTGDVYLGGVSNSEALSLNLWNSATENYDTLTLDDSGWAFPVGASFGGQVSATGFNGDGSSLTNLPAGNLASGTVPTARLGSGTANSTTYLRGDGTWATVSGGGLAIGGAVSGGTATRVLFEGAGPVLAHDAGFRWLGVSSGGLRIDGGSSDKLMSLGNTSGGRSAYLGYYDAGGQLLFGRSDHSTTASVQINADSVQYLCPTYGAPFVFVTTGAPLVFTPAAAGGDGPIQFGRRLSDSNAACGASVECWPTTTQTTPALAIMAPGGASYRAQWRPSGAIRLAALSDAAAENDTTYFSTTNSKLSYKDSGGTVYALYSGSSLPALADGAAANSTLYFSTTNGKPSWKDSGGTVTPLF